MGRKLRDEDLPGMTFGTDDEDEPISTGLMVPKPLAARPQVVPPSSKPRRAMGADPDVSALLGLRKDAAQLRHLLIGVLYDERFVDVQHALRRGIDHHRAMRRNVDVFYPDFATLVANGGDLSDLRALVGQICTKDLHLRSKPDFPLVAVLADGQNIVTFTLSSEPSDFEEEWNRLLAILSADPGPFPGLADDWATVSEAIRAAKYQRYRKLGWHATRVIGTEAMNIVIQEGLKRLGGSS